MEVFESQKKKPYYRLVLRTQHCWKYCNSVILSEVIRSDVWLGQTPTASRRWNDTDKRMYAPKEPHVLKGEKKQRLKLTVTNQLGQTRPIRTFASL